MLFDKQSKNILNVFDMKLFRHKYENVWLESFECIIMFELKSFMKIVSYNISYFASELEIFDPWTAVDPQFCPLTVAFYPMGVTCTHVFI